MAKQNDPGSAVAPDSAESAHEVYRSAKRTFAGFAREKKKLETKGESGDNSESRGQCDGDNRRDGEVAKAETALDDTLGGFGKEDEEEQKEKRDGVYEERRGKRDDEEGPQVGSDKLLESKIGEEEDVLKNWKRDIEDGWNGLRALLLEEARELDRGVFRFEEESGDKEHEGKCEVSKETTGPLLGKREGDHDVGSEKGLDITTVGFEAGYEEEREEKGEAYHKAEEKEGIEDERDEAPENALDDTTFAFEEDKKNQRGLEESREMPEEKKEEGESTSDLNVESANGENKGEREQHVGAGPWKAAENATTRFGWEVKDEEGMGNEHGTKKHQSDNGVTAGSSNLSASHSALETYLKHEAEMDALANELHMKLERFIAEELEKAEAEAQAQSGLDGESGKGRKQSRIAKEKKEEQKEKKRRKQEERKMKKERKKQEKEKKKREREMKKASEKLEREKKRKEKEKEREQKKQEKENQKKKQKEEQENDKKTEGLDFRLRHGGDWGEEMMHGSWY